MANFVLFQLNVATEQFSIQKDAFIDMICIWLKVSKNTSDKLFSCVPKDRVSMLGNFMESAAQVPASLFHQVQEVVGHDNYDQQRVVVAMYKNNKFFPVSEDVRNVVDVTSPVVGVKLGKLIVYLVKPCMFHNHSILNSTQNIKNCLFSEKWKRQHLKK